MGRTRSRRGHGARQPARVCARGARRHAGKQPERRVPAPGSLIALINIWTNMSTDIFSRTAWDRNAPIYDVIRRMPFNTELAAGMLSEARFKHYITQDAHYLSGFGRALTLAAAKAPNPDRIVQFAKSAEGAIVVERALHGSFFARYGIP